MDQTLWACLTLYKEATNSTHFRLTFRHVLLVVVIFNILGICFVYFILYYDLALCIFHPKTFNPHILAQELKAYQTKNIYNCPLINKYYFIYKS